jgi:hypothetical protein
VRPRSTSLSLAACNAEPTIWNDNLVHIVSGKLLQPAIAACVCHIAYWSCLSDTSLDHCARRV